jgi:hypothetical protein
LGHTARGFVPQVSRSEPLSSSEAGSASVVSKVPSLTQSIGSHGPRICATGVRSSSSEAGSASVVSKGPTRTSGSGPRPADLCHRCPDRSLGRLQKQAVLRSFRRLAVVPSGSGHTHWSSSSEAGSASDVSKATFQGSRSYPKDRVTRPADSCHWCLGRSLGRRQREAVLR